MTKQKSQKNHDPDEKIALPGHKGKHTPPAFHRKDASQISVHKAQEPKVMNKEGEDKAESRNPKGLMKVFGS